MKQQVVFILYLYYTNDLVFCDIIIIIITLLLSHVSSHICRLHYVAGNIKKEWQVPMLHPATLCQGGLCTSGQWLASSYLVETLTQLQNLSTQLTKFPLAGCYHTSPMLQNSHGLLWCISGIPTLCRTFLSGTQLNRCVKENTTQT